MNGARFSLSGERLFGSDRTLDSTGPWCLHNSSNLGLKRLRCVIRELIDTEQNYVQSICDLDTGYLAQLRQDPRVDPSVVNMIFGQIGDLRVFHEQLLLSFQLHRDDLVQLARVFLSHAKRFEHLYVDFCINYCRSIRKIQEAKQLRTVLWNKLIICQQNLGHQLPVETYLLKPVQRVLKYQLLLQECVKHCISAIHSMNEDKPPTRLGRAASSSNGLDVTESELGLLQHLNDAVPVLGQALERMIKVADHINEKKRCRELIDQLRSMRLDVDSWGELVLRGHFRIPGKKDLRLILLFHRAILLCKYTSASQSAASSGVGGSSSADQLWLSGAPYGTTEFSSSNSSLLVSGHAIHGTAIQIREVISCANLMLVECIPKCELAFHILPFDNPKAQRTLQAPTLEIKRLWCREIKRLILENYDAAIPEKAKHIVLNMSELSTAQGLLDGVRGSLLATVGGESDYGWSDRTDSQSAMTTTHGRTSASMVNMLQVEPVRRSSAGQRKQRYSDTTVPGCSHSEGSPSKATLKSPTHISSHEGDSTDGLDSVFHDVWNKIWSKHSHSLSQTNGSTVSSNSPDASQSATEPQESSITVDGALCDTDADFRCIAVEINEERLGVCVTSTDAAAASKPPLNSLSTSRSTGLLNNQKRAEQTRTQKPPAPRPPELLNSSINRGSSNSRSNSTTPSSLIRRTQENSNRLRDRSKISSVYIDCPNASCYDVVTFGRAYEHYIAKARAQVALSPRDLDEIFSPLRQLVQSDSPGAVVRAAMVPLPENTNAAELRQQVNGERAATADRDPFFYRQTSPAQSNCIHSASVMNEFPDTAYSDGKNEADNCDGASSRGSSGASSPRHLVSRIAVSHFQNAKENTKLTKTIVVKPPNDSTTIGEKPALRSAYLSVELGESKIELPETDVEQNGCMSTRNRFTTTIHAGVLSTPRRQKTIESGIDFPPRNPTFTSHVQSGGDPVHNRLKPEQPVNGCGSLTKRSAPLNKGLDESFCNKNGQASLNKPRSLSTVNRGHVLALSHLLDLSSVRKCSTLDEQPSSPRSRSASYNETSNELLTRRNPRKSRAAPPPPPLQCSAPIFPKGSDRAPLAEPEGVKDPEENTGTVASSCHGQLKVVTTHEILPYADDSSTCTNFSIRSSIPDSTQTVRVCGDQPVKPPRRLTLPICSPSPSPVDIRLNPPSCTRATTNPPLHLSPNPSNHYTKGLSQPIRTNGQCQGIVRSPRRGIVRNMIDRFQR